MTPSGRASGFPVSHCAQCGRDVLTHVHLDARDEERRLCLHCDAEIDPREVRWVLEAELGRLGYATGGEEAAGCGRPGCGQGRCGRVERP
jgi:hypothetical protein